MKLYTTPLAALLLLFCLVSCEKPVFPDTDDSVLPSEANLIVSVYQYETVPFSPQTTRAVVDDVCTRLNFAVYDMQNGRVKQVNQQVGEKNFGTAYFRVDPGQYRVVVVAHSSDGNPEMVDPTKIQFDNKKGYSDTLLSNDTVDVDDEPVTLPVNIRRVVSLCRFEVTDSIPADVSRMRFYYTGGSGAFDAATGLGSVHSRQTVFYPVETGSTSSVFDLYTFLWAPKDTIHLQASAYDASDNVLYEQTFDVPMERRMITKLSGPYFSGASGSSIVIIIGVDNEWEGEHVIYYAPKIQ